MGGHSLGGRTQLGVINAMIVALVVAIIGAIAIPVIEKANRHAQISSLLQSLHTLRSQIELYKMEHGGEPPLLFDGSFPQLIRATNGAGIPGPPGRKYPYGPYLRTAIPINPITGRSVVTPTDTFPPKKPSGNGGWIYHQRSGQIAVDLEEFLTR